MNSREKPYSIVFIISDINKAIGFEWIVENIDRKRFDLSFILLNNQPSYLGKYLKEKGIPVDEFPAGGKTRWPFTILKIRRILKKRKADAIHTHLYIADILGQLAGRLAGVRKRIYTRHSSNENSKYHKKKRIDQFINSMSTHIVAISENVKNILVDQENVNPSRIRLIHHGFDLDRFENVPSAEIQELREKYNPGGKRPVIGVVARYSHWKGIQHTIAAFKKLLEKEPNALLVLANAKKGDFKDELAELLNTLPPGSYHEIVFEPNLFALYHLFDVYVHIPIDEELEAFGQTFVEALAAGIPSVFTMSGVAREFIVHGRNALVVDFKNEEQVYESISRLLTDQSLREKLKQHGREDVRKMFTLRMMIERFENLYSE